MSPFISIIIPFYGTADPVLLQRCLDSIRRQGMEEGSYEIIVVDDNGKGLGGARNQGIRQATGTYLMFVDADDYLFPNLSYCFPYLLKYTPDVCSFQMCEVNRPGVIPQSFNYKWEVYESGAEYMSKNNFMGTAWWHFFSRSFLIISMKMKILWQKHIAWHRLLSLLIIRFMPILEVPLLLFTKELCKYV